MKKNNINNKNSTKIDGCFDSEKSIYKIKRTGLKKFFVK